MPWHNEDYPPSYKNQPDVVREKAVEIANGLLQDGMEEQTAIVTGLQQARELLENHAEKNEGYGNASDNNVSGKSISGATDPSKLPDI